MGKRAYDRPLDGQGDFHLHDGIYFGVRYERKVVIYRKQSEAAEPVILVETDAGGWCSAVLSVSAFGERPGDWHAMMEHHMGRKDMLVGQRGGY